ncbi:Nuclear poly(A) polymerase 3 [Dichanthelium oligosanthes]|uniref:Nuclear poly(A) polymerase 3 n=1 Tax=Dichanthelium oligosanthes TaxID=888268 RepID=A0A1E5VZU0_9POAL|nr:Nuclear poly(A) polymerase 3 [Dichanthelium oligosanthes]
MALDLAAAGSVARKAAAQTLAPVLLMGPPPPPPIPPTPGMYLPGPPPPGVLLPRPIPMPLPREVMAHMDECRSRSLLTFISDAGIMPSQEEERRREWVVCELGKIVMDWAKRVAYDQGKQHWIASATVLTYGSYALGAYGPESDIDVLCVGPYIASLQQHFFVVLRHMLEGRAEVSELHLIEGAKVPLMRFKFNGILIDFPYVQLPVINAADVSIMIFHVLLVFVYYLILHVLQFFMSWNLLYTVQAIHAFDPRVLENVDGASWRCLSGVRANRQIIQLVPNMKRFQYLLRCLKLWARKRGLHCHVEGLHVSLIDRLIISHLFLPQDIRTTDFDWSWLFAPFPYGARYKCFLRIVLSSPMAEELRDWVGWVKSRFRNLLLKLESLGVYCDPDPSEQVDHTITEPNVVFFWGLMYRRNIQICTSSLKEDFMKSVFNNIYGKEKCAHSDITMSIVGTPQLHKSVFDHSVYSEKLPPHMMGHQLMKQSCSAVS